MLIDSAVPATTTLGPLYRQLVHQSVLSVNAEQVASFLGRHVTAQLAQEIGSQFAVQRLTAATNHTDTDLIDFLIPKVPGVEW